MTRHPFTALREESLLLAVDFQEAMKKAVPRWEETGLRAAQLGRAAALLGIPAAVTEHYPKGLGPTFATVLDALAAPRLFVKEHFSACLEEGFVEDLRSFARPTVVLCGMEAHVCVLQTGLDLIQAGFRVHLVADAVASRSDADRAVGVDLFRAAGAVITSAETVIFQWARRANTAEFRSLLPIVK